MFQVLLLQKSTMREAEMTGLAKLLSPISVFWGGVVWL